jgi:hypothetical protein
MASTAWHRRLRGAGFWAAVVLAVLVVAGLGVALPIVLAVHSSGTTAEEYALAPVTICSIALGAAASWWLKGPLRDTLGPRQYEIGGRQRRLQRYQDRASKLRVASALLAYYLPAVLVTIRRDGTAGLEDYFRGHLMDGFGFVGFLAIGWQLVTRDIHRAAQRLTQSSVIIAMAGAYTAGGTGAEIGIAAVFGQALFERLWQWVTSATLDAADEDDSAPRHDLWYQVAASSGNELSAGELLREHHCLRSRNGRYSLIMWDGQLAIWGPDDTAPAWTTGTGRSGAVYAALDDSGRLGLYGPDGALVAWQSQVPGGDARLLRLEDNGVLAAYRADGAKVWATLPTPAGYNRFIFSFDPPPAVEPPAPAADPPAPARPAAAS